MCESTLLLAPHYASHTTVISSSCQLTPHLLDLLICSQRLVRDCAFGRADLLDNALNGQTGLLCKLVERIPETFTGEWTIGE